MKLVILCSLDAKPFGKVGDARNESSSAVLLPEPAIGPQFLELGIALKGRETATL